jgi:flagellar protein FlaG
LFINVIDVKSDRILRQFPSEDAVDIMSKMRELVGMLFDTKG